ncbi:hypothetical protein V8E52_001019 [Russula decolorans]|jgi:hypothetical protein
MPSSSPEAKPAQPKDAQDTSGAKDPVASDGGTEQEKQAVNDDGATAKVEASAPAVTKSQAAPAPVSSEKPPLPASDSTPAPASTDPEKAQADQDSSVPVTTAGVPAEPGSRVPDAQERWRKRRLLKIHTRLARFFNWILLVGFVILPSTFARDAAGGNHSSEPEIVQDAKSHIENHGVFAIGFFCCLVNGLAICYLWYIRKDDHEWLFTNLFTAGLINSFSGLISTFVNFYGVKGTQPGSSAYATFALASFCTFVYAVLTTVYFRKRLRARHQRGSRASSAMV